MAPASAPPFVPIEDYGLIGNCRTAALVSRHGSIDWCCFPRFDSQSFFGGLLDREAGGGFSISPAEKYESRQQYLTDTNVLETTFRCSTGSARLVDCFTVASEREKKNNLGLDHEILRVIEGIEGEVCFRLRFRPRQDYGKSGFRLAPMGNWAIHCLADQEFLVLASSLDVSLIQIRERDLGDEAHAVFSVKAGERIILSLVYAREAPAVLPVLGDSAMARLERTIRYWRDWAGRCDYHGPYAEHVRRSALTLKLLAFAPSGAVIGAPTTSLPETREGMRNWDYRYCWLRDASFTVRALDLLGYTDEAVAYTSWLMHSTRLTRPRLQVVYSVFGESRLPERNLYWLEGYGDSRPVRVGNHASTQFQLDIYGEVLDAVSHIVNALDGVADSDTQDLLIGMGRAVGKLWEQPDDGIWEGRGSPAHHTHSKVMAWVAMDRIGKLARKFRWRLDYDPDALAFEIRTAIELRGYNRRLKTYVGAFGRRTLDASLLTMPMYGYCDGSTERMLNTIEAIKKDLSRNQLLYRYPPESDGLPGVEGAFGICNFWMAQALALAGRLDESKEWIETMLNRAKPTLLWSEEIDPETGAFLGNFPQAFTHIGMINAALVLCGRMKGERAA